VFTEVPQFPKKKSNCRNKENSRMRKGEHLPGEGFFGAADAPPPGARQKVTRLRFARVSKPLPE
jgi:hypothetical protein